MRGIGNCWGIVGALLFCWGGSVRGIVRQGGWSRRAGSKSHHAGVTLCRAGSVGASGKIGVALGRAGSRVHPGVRHGVAAPAGEAGGEAPGTAKPRNPATKSGPGVVPSRIGVANVLVSILMVTPRRCLVAIAAVRLVTVVAVLGAALTKLMSHLRGSAALGPIQHLALQPLGPVHICFPPMPPGRSTPGPTALAGQRLAPHIDRLATFAAVLHRWPPGRSTPGRSTPATSLRTCCSA